ncbi:MASE3 domain-containing protein [Desulfocicer vacuolatum]|nr:MASE3 domain-containing protein [Desulfocicer vacuolatum]
MNVTIGIALLLGLLIVSRHNYLLFHSLAEFFSIAVAFALFIVVWNSRQFVTNTAFVYIGIAYLFIGSLDLIHTISYKGMGVISETWGANPATQLWIAARYMESISLFLFFAFFKKRFQIYKTIIIYFFISAFILFSIFYWKNFPACFVEETGLTDFKKISEYFICIILFVTLSLILKNRSNFDQKILKFFIASIVLTIFGELAFTFYVSVYGLSNLFGHYLKIISFFLIYSALVRSSLKEPYKILFQDLNFERHCLKKSKDLLDAASRMARIGGWELDIHTRQVTWSEETYRIHEMDMTYKPSLQEAINFFHVRDRERLQLAIQKSLDHGEPYDMEIRFITAKGNQLWTRTICKPQIVNGKTVKLTGVFQDITERKKAEEEHDRLISAIEQVGDVVVITDIDGVIQYTNPAFMEITGFSKKEAWGKTPRFLKSGQHDNHFYKTLWNTILSGEQWTGRIVNKRKDGTLYTGECSISPVNNQDGDIANFVWISRDITKQLEIEHQSQQNQKLESIGSLAGGIAHDFNNILSSVIGFTELALDEVEKDTTIEDSLQEVYAAGKRAKDLVGQILAFARQSEEELKPVQVSSIVKEVLKFMRSSIPTTIEIHQSIESDSLIMGNATRIHQVMMNLCTNAAHAMDEMTGVLEIRLKDVAINGDVSTKTSELKPGDYIQITVSDTGTGIAPEIIGSIFEPYFTTKGPGEGSGMGLAMVHGIIETYDGKITVNSRVGQGTTFTIYLPITGKRHERPPYEQGDLPSGTEKILFVDDEIPIAKMGSQVLERLGYQVTIKTNSIEAVALFKSNPNAFDLVITDMTMPDMTGDRLAIELMKIRQGMPVILCTGYSKKISDKISSEIGIKAFIYKPVVKAELAETVRKVLDEAG